MVGLHGRVAFTSLLPSNGVASNSYGRTRSPTRINKKGEDLCAHGFWVVPSCPRIVVGRARYRTGWVHALPSNFAAKILETN